MSKTSVLDRIAEESITSINAGYRLFNLEIQKDVKSDETVCYGLTDFGEGKVLLEKGMNPHTAKETLIHELTHIVLDLVGLGDESDEEPARVAPVSNEELTTRVSRGFLLLMNLNPKLFSILNEQ